jgi:ankyrin repeat protein
VQKIWYNKQQSSYHLISFLVAIMFDVKLAENALKGFKFEVFALQFSLKGINTPINEFGQTWLHIFSYYGNEFQVKMLIENHIAVKATDNLGHTALHYAAMRGNIVVSKLLLNAGITINEKTINGDTALHYASLGGHTDYMTFLLDNEAEKQAVNKDGLSALHYAIA